ESYLPHQCCSSNRDYSDSCSVLEELSSRNPVLSGFGLFLSFLIFAFQEKSRSSVPGKSLLTVFPDHTSFPARFYPEKDQACASWMYRESWSRRLYFQVTLSRFANASASPILTKSM